MKPIEVMMNSIHWEPVEVEPDTEGDLPHVTHTGYLDVGDYLFKCHQLSNGKRVIDADDLNKFFSSNAPR